MSYSDLIELLNNIVETNKSAKKDVFERFLNLLKNISSTNGFHEDQLINIWKKILSNQFSKTRVVSTIKYLIPSKTVSQDNIDFLVGWCYMKHSINDNHLIIISILQWLIGIFLYKIVDPKTAQNCYYTLLNMLQPTRRLDEVCYLLYVLTDYSMVTQYSIKKINDCRKSTKDNKSCWTLLSLYKRLKPHLLGDIVIYQNEFKRFPPLIKKNLHLLEQTLNRQGVTYTIPENCVFPNWESNLIAFNSASRDKIVYITTVTPVDAVKLCKKENIFNPGTTPKSFLENQFGFMYLVLLNNDQLYKVIDLYIESWLGKYESNLYSVNLGFREFCSHIYNLQKFLGQEILCVRKFLLRNIQKWRAVKYRKEIFNLLEHFCIKSFEEFFTKILLPLYDKCLEENSEFARYTLHCIGEIICNNIRYLNVKSFLLSQLDDQTPTPESIIKTQQCYKHLCMLLTNRFKGDAEILHEIVDNYILFSNLESSDVPVDFVIPIEIVHKILINSEYVLINKLGKLLVSTIRSSNPAENLSIQIIDVNEVFFKNILKSSIFVNSLHYPNLDKVIHQKSYIKNIFRARNNLGFYCLTRLNDDKKYVEEFDKKNFIRNLERDCKHLIDLFTVVST